MNAQLKQSSAAHTPGPWAINEDIEHARIFGNGFKIATLDTHPQAGFSHHNNDANARLIAAAPDLLDALQKILTISTEAYLSSYNPFEALEHVRDRALAALAKAGV